MGTKLREAQFVLSGRWYTCCTPGCSEMGVRGISADQGAFSQDFDVIEGSERLSFLTYDFTANFDDFVKHVAQDESEHED